MRHCDSVHSLVTTRWLNPLVPIVGALVICTIGCAVRKAPGQQEIVARALPAGTKIPLNWTASSIDGDVRNDWLKTFNDAQLSAIVAEAIANNLDLRQAAERVEEARQTAIVVGAQLKPYISSTVGGAGTVRSPSGDLGGSYATYGLLSWEIDVWGRLRAERASAEESYEAVGLDYAFARQSLSATAADCWYLAVETRQLVAFAQEYVKTYTRLLELAKLRRAAGKVADLDVAQASAVLDAAQSGLRQAQAEYSDARRILEILMGRYPSSDIAIEETFSPLPPPVQPGMPSSLLERRPDIVAAERQVQVAFHVQEAARLALYPSFSLNLAGGHLDDLLLGAQGTSFIHSGIGMLVPIYEGGALRAQLKIATAEQEKAVAYYGSVTLKAFKEVETALTDENLLSQRIPFENSAVENRSEAVRLAEIKYKYGSADLFFVLTLQAEQISQQIELIKLHYALLRNRINLHLALGGSFDATPAATLPAPP
jgi:outer membrane protein, multidrug efflux system